MQNSLDSTVSDEALIAVSLTVVAVANTAIFVGLCNQSIRYGREQISIRRIASAYETHAANGNSDLPHRLLKPHGLKTDTHKKWPLLIFLHGAGERGADNFSQLLGVPAQIAAGRWKRDFPCFLLAPQCPFQSQWSKQLERIERLIENTALNHPVDHSRIYLTGLSMGRTGTWELAAHCPDRFAAIAPMCGAPDVAWAKSIASIPVWTCHGEADQTISVAYSRKMVNALRTAGATPVFHAIKGADTNAGQRLTLSETE